MAENINIRNFESVIQYADLEDLPNGAATQLENMRFINGKIVKTSELGAFLTKSGIAVPLDTSGKTITGFGTWRNPNLSSSSQPVGSGTGYLYFVVLVDDATNALEVYTWDGTSESWVAIDALAAGIDLTTAPFYQTLGTDAINEHNPVVLSDGVLRLLPGYTAKPDGTNVAVGCWIGHIDRDLFDELFTITAGFYSEPLEIAAPSLTLSLLQLQGGTFNPLVDKPPITDVSEANDTITFYGEWAGRITQYAVLKVADNASNDGAYLIDKVEYDEANDKTVVHFDSTFNDLAGSAEDGHMEIPPAGEYRYYRFAYVYDGNQESLLSDPTIFKFDLTAGLFARFQWDIDETTVNNRLTAIKVYRSTTHDGTYYHIQTIDFLRKSEDVLGATNSARTGHGCAYVPELEGYPWISGTTYTLYLRAKDGTWKYIQFTGLVADTSEPVFYPAAKAYGYAGEDLWDVAWYLFDGAVVQESGGSGAYAGEQTVIVSSDTGDLDAAGGVFFLDHGAESGVASNKAAVSAATADGSDRTKFATTNIHSLEPGDVVELYGFSDPYDGVYQVLNTPSTTTFVVGVKYKASDTGYFLLSGKERVVDNNYNRAVHLAKKYAASVLDEGWKLMKPVKGLYYPTESGTTITYRFYDTGLPDGAKHPLDGEVSVTVNGTYAALVSGRLHQAKVVLDPADKAEQHEDWGAFSELDQYDVRPVSNVLRVPGGGGPLTGVWELFGFALYTKEDAITAYNTKRHPDNPALWTRQESIVGLGSVAPLGAVRAGKDLYVCSWDNINRIRPNNLSSSSETPLEGTPITEAIYNIYNSMTAAQKRAIRGVFHKRRNEIHWFMEYPVDSVDTIKHWAYNVITGAWREVDSAYYVNSLATDQDSNAIALEAYTSIAARVTAVETEATDSRFTFRSKQFPIGDREPQPINTITVFYKSPHALKLKIYLDGNETMVEEYTLPAQADFKPYTIGCGYSGYRFQFVITDDTGVALVVEEAGTGATYLIVEQNELSPNVEIGGMDINVGR